MLSSNQKRTVENHSDLRQLSAACSIYPRYEVQWYHRTDAGRVTEQKNVRLQLPTKIKILIRFSSCIVLSLMSVGGKEQDYAETESDCESSPHVKNGLQSSLDCSVTVYCSLSSSITHLTPPRMLISSTGVHSRDNPPQRSNPYLWAWRSPL